MSAPSLELLFYRAPKPLDWSSPRRLLVSTLKNRFHWVGGHFYPHPISHVNIVLRTSTGQVYPRGMALASSPLGYLYRFLFKRSSLDTLVVNLPGRFIDEKWIWSPLPQYKSQGYVQSLKILLTPEQCSRIEYYLLLYEKSNMNRIYGALASDPLKGQGAGCSAFAVSLLELLGLITPDIENSWSRQLRIPEDMVTSKKRVARFGFFRMLFGADVAWAEDSEPHYSLRFWDPEKMFNWCQRILRNEHLNTDIHVDLATKELIWDARLADLPPLNLKHHFESLSPQIEKELNQLGQHWDDNDFYQLQNRITTVSRPN
jgi:hypothetical protein